LLPARNDAHKRQFKTSTFIDLDIITEIRLSLFDLCFSPKQLKGRQPEGNFTLWTSLYYGLRVCSQQIIIPYIKSWVTTTCWSCIAIPSIKDGKSIYYHGPYELCNNAGGSQKLFNFILKLYFYTAKQGEKTMTRREREISLGLLSTCLLVMEFRIDAMLCSNLGNQKSNSAIFNVYTGFIWPAGRRLPPIGCRV